MLTQPMPHASFCDRRPPQVKQHVGRHAAHIGDVVLGNRGVDAGTPRTGVDDDTCDFVLGRRGHIAGRDVGPRVENDGGRRGDWRHRARAPESLDEDADEEEGANHLIPLLARYAFARSRTAGSAAGPAPAPVNSRTAQITIAFARSTPLATVRLLSSDLRRDGGDLRAEFPRGADADVYGGRDGGRTGEREAGDDGKNCGFHGMAFQYGCGMDVFHTDVLIGTPVV